MSEFTKVLDRIHENLQNGQPMFDGIEYLMHQGPLRQSKWVDADHLTADTVNYRVKPVVTGMFDVDVLVDLFNKNSGGIGYSAANLFIQDLVNVINEFVESKLPAVREQAIREFIDQNQAKYKYPHWQYEWFCKMVSPYLQGSGNPSDKPEGQLVKGPERGEPKPANEQTITVKVPHLMFEPGTPVPSDFPAAPVMAEQRITIQPGDYVPHELITSEAVHEFIVKCFVAAGFKDARPHYGVRRSIHDKGLGTDRDRDILWTDGTEEHERPLTLQQLFNATNGMEWPENTNYLFSHPGRIEYSMVSYAPPYTPGTELLAYRVNSFTPEKATRRAIQPGDVLLLSDDIEVSDGLLLALREVTDKANLNLHRTSRTFYFQDQTKTMYPPSNVSIEEVFNASNGLVWPESATWLEISSDSWCFVDDKRFDPNAKLAIPRK